MTQIHMEHDGIKKLICDIMLLDLRLMNDDVYYM
jgi:hypothetical protein